MSDNTPTFANFFALFEQPIAFDIDTSQLSKRLRQLQQQFHPDNLSSDESASSQQNSAIINHAYATLLHPDSRANYLLELSGQELNTDHSIADLDFLDDAMDMRMALDDAEGSADLATIKSLKSKAEQRIETHSNRFETAYNQQDWSTAMDATQKLKFLVKLKKDMDTAIDNSHQQPDDDDELYL
ncbi:Fe-S protein assembly co-chaperone HscB [Psychrobacter sp. FDAARGOS_221]|uniref:Fe-S protein assembly co-chaperone HscB n=1 Tax=Psychrobacter sp. FDAARGOS_221 TaxID=1975705 RepID=UPI000BB53D8C|nr:Fe-S protein assembly co-chaperone HscB [Psychrobacter sp. FDAARGOS_221]PNK59987.1 Fe-S protein assembly co-chaperone HscB [Psychrobacter sp. FDAARGOS_221]